MIHQVPDSIVVGDLQRAPGPYNRTGKHQPSMKLARYSSPRNPKVQCGIHPSTSPLHPQPFFSWPSVVC
ncbi:hypothetical protein VN97_g11366 [Penicillium thymicola]|uniref:Uncharacterized protein n=1 Tax=Penicillium thymicola TaxID=293382 RepID=A0AAI9X2Y8_PENTH|nr:hypothetical protein VN97_g11366 [Penicillium thymicola]